MANIPYKILEKKQKFQIKVYAVLSLITLVVVGWYGFTQWQDYSFAREGIDDGGGMVNVLSDQVLEQKLNYEKVEVEFDAFNEEMKKRLSVIFPADDQYTNLTRQIDEIEESLAKKHDRFEVANLSFQNVVFGEEYNVLPFKMNIISSSHNFTKFLHLIEGSGSLNGELRLMDIASIRLNFENARSSDEDSEDLISFVVQVNAYFQK